MNALNLHRSCWRHAGSAGGACYSGKVPRQFRAAAFSLLVLAGLPFARPGLPRLQAQGRTQKMVRVTGKVLDQSGGALPRASVEVRDGAREVVAVTHTNGRGEFVFNLEEGRYTVSARLAGFVALRDEPLHVSGSEIPIVLTLEIPAVEQQIVVTATRTESPIAQVGSSTTVLTADQMTREGISTLSDALRRVAGLNLVQSGGYGQLTSLFLRGGESKYARVMIDGIAVNEPGGSFNFANMSTLDIDRIEVVRGPQSALFGSDAIAGVIQIFTRRGTSEGLAPAPRFLMEGGSFAGYRYAAGISGKGRHMDYSASFGRSDTDNATPNGSFNEETATGNLGFSLSKSTDLHVVFRSESGRAGVPGPFAFQRPEPDEYYRHRNLAGGIRFTFQPGVQWKQQLSYSVSDSRQFSEDPSDSGAFTVSYQGRTTPYPGLDFAYQTLNDTRKQRIGYQTDITLPRGHLLTGGGEYERESGVIGDPRFAALEAARDNYGGYLQDQWSYRNRLFAAAGVRLEHNRSFGFYAAPRVSVALLLHQQSPGSVWGLARLKGNLGLGIKEPTLVESYSQSPYFRGNPNLRPEKSRSFDVGLEQHFGADQGAVELTYFDNRFRDQIGFVTTDFTTYEGTFFNIGKTRARGVETVLRQSLGLGFEFSGSFTYLDSKVLESSNDFDPVYAKGQGLLRRPRLSGCLDLRWKPARWTLGATALIVGKRVDSDFEGLGLTSNPAYGVLNLLASFKLADGTSIFVSGNNVLNRNYMEVLGYPGLRANFRVGIQTGF